jgi:transcriptional regulator with XRE-family HTH domain
MNISIAKFCVLSMSSRDSFIRNLKKIRTEKGYSQEKLAELSDLHRTYVSSVERGERNITIDNMEKLAQGLSVDIRELLSPLEAQKKRKSDLAEFLRLQPSLRQFQDLANKHNIRDVFQDNGGKYVQLLILLGLKSDGAREGNDATDSDGREYELKTVNLELQKQFTTHHHLNPTIIAKYRRMDWFFAAFESIELKVIYRLTPGKLEKYFGDWENKWYSEGGKDINNPKIPLKYVMEHGDVAWLPKGVAKFVPPAIKKDPNRAVVHRGSKTKETA